MNPTPDSAAGWDRFWQGGQHGAALSGGTDAHPAIAAFWAGFFDGPDGVAGRADIIDIGSGSGALIETVRKTVAGGSANITCLDISAAAVRRLTERFTGISGVVADAADIPLADASFDLAISQFGVEYAGLDAVLEMRRLLRPGGRLACLLHHRDGGVYRQCRANRNALERLRASGFLPLSRRMFEAGFAACRGADRGPYDRAASRLAPAIRELDSILAEYGPGVADELLLRLRRDLRTLHDRMPQYEAAAVLDWLDGMDAETTAYAERMEAMCTAAIPADRFEGLCRQLEDSGGTLQRAAALVDTERRLPLAWALVASIG